MPLDSTFLAYPTASPQIVQILTCKGLTCIPQATLLLDHTWTGLRVRGPALIKPTRNAVAMALVFWAEACGLEPESPWKNW